MISLNHTKKIGIWGLGITGKSLLSYLSNFPFKISVTDLKFPSHEHRLLMDQKGIIFISSEHLELFLEENDIIFPSAGIDLRPYKKYQHKFKGEIDLFCSVWQKPVIAITGTLGKTTITTLLSHLLKNIDLTITTGGNIGTGLLDLIEEKNADYAVIELSSFQLELSTLLNPSLAILTNIYPNHLDRHTTFEEYFQAKCNLIRNQNPHHAALLPLETAPLIKEQLWACNRSFYFFSDKNPSSDARAALSKEDTLFYKIQDTLIKEKNDQQEIIYTEKFPAVSYPINWLILLASLHILKRTFISHTLEIPQHRLELIATHNTYTFYNDSKSTLMQATIAALEKFPHQKIILFLGGKSKGVDRTPFIHLLKDVYYVLCFGTEASLLCNVCILHQIPASSFTTLDEAFWHAIKIAQPHTLFLLSPGGASYDLFKDYYERGDYFKNLVLRYIQNS